MTIRALFPTSLYTARLPDDDWREALEEACWMVEDGDASKSNLYFPTLNLRL